MNAARNAKKKEETVHRDATSVHSSSPFVIFFLLLCFITRFKSIYGKD